MGAGCANPAPPPAPPAASSSAAVAAAANDHRPPASPAQQPGGEVRALWVSRFEYARPVDISTAMARAADLGMTDVLFQVRGQADAHYRSALEPWSEKLLAEVGAGVGEDPGFDPLALACTEARRHRLRLHAWINVMPLWMGTTPPADRSHRFYKSPGWRLKNAAGRPQSLNDHYVIVNPTLPAVHAHIVAVVRDIAGRYPVDGIHLDYIRFVSDTMAPGDSYLDDPASHALFRRATGLDAAAEPGAFRDYVAGRITDLVRAVGGAARGARPGVVVSAAVWRDDRTGRRDYLQDWPRWVEEGLLDWVLPMTYTADVDTFEADLVRALAQAARGRGARLVPGIGLYKHTTAAASAAQWERARELGAGGVALFSYRRLYPAPGRADDPLRRGRREAWRRFASAHGDG